MGKNTRTVLLVALIDLTAACGLIQGAQRVSLNGEWRFWTGETSYEPIDVPFSRPPRGTISAYQKVFTIPPDARTRLILLRFEAIAGQGTVYLNGRQLGKPGSFTPFWYDVSDLINRDGENDLIVTIDDRRDNTTIPYEDIPWIHSCGIIRDVYLECAETVLMTSMEPQYDLLNNLTCVEGEVTVRAAAVAGEPVWLAGALLDGQPGQWEQIATLTAAGPFSADANGQIKATLTFTFDQPELWSPESPRLYALYVAALGNGGLESERLIQTGFRDVRVQGNDILLNGQPLLLKGISRHDLYPGTGYVGTHEQMVEDMTRIKSTGANYVRLVHYPPHPAILDLADQLGLLVSEEVPAWANFWDPDVRQGLYEMIEAMIRRDMRHPSVFLWLSGNARAHPMPYAAEAQALIRGLDRNRLGSYVIDNDEYEPEAIAADMVFFHEADLDVYLKITWWFYYVEYLQDAWVNFPKDVPLVIAEFGREGNDREPLVVDGEIEYWLSEEQQAGAVAEMLEAWRPHLPQYNAEEHIAGLCLFNYQDTGWPEIDRYLPNHIPSLHWGVVYEDRAPKKLLGTLTNFYSSLPTAFVGLPQPEDAEVERRFHEPQPLGSGINGLYRESGATISADGRTLIFASDGSPSLRLPALYISRLEDGVWSPPAKLDLPPDDEPFAFRDSPALSYDGDTLYFTRALVSGIYVVRTRIWCAHRENGTWGDLQDLGDVVNAPNPAGITADPCISADGNMLFFTSDRPGGHGRTDIWMSRRVNGTWTEPENLGPQVNSPYGDSEPSLSPDGRTLYFCSDRPGGMGSSDIWVSRLVDGQWSAPKNLGPEVNSPGADREPEVSKDGRSLFFTGIRAGGHGLSDLWQASTLFLPGDFDHDFDVDAADMEHLITCLSGPKIPQNSPSCLDARLDDDTDVDQEDFGLLQRNFTGSREVAASSSGLR